MNLFSSLIKKNGPIIGTYLLIAIIFWFIFLIIIPQLYMVDLSFRPNLSPLERGGDKDFYTLEHYKHFLFGSAGSNNYFNVVDISVFFKTFLFLLL